MYGRPEYIRSRSHLLTEQQKGKICELVTDSSSIVEAAEAVGVTLRALERERERDEDFDQQLRMALHSPADPLKLMQAAARTHWRAAAWLLERTRPEQYARRPTNTTNSGHVTRALNAMIEATLEKLPEDQRTEMYVHLSEVSRHLYDCCFPNSGPWGQPRERQLPKTPLANHEQYLQAVANSIGKDRSFEELYDKFYGKAEPAKAVNDNIKAEVVNQPAPEHPLAPGSSNRGPNDAPTETGVNSIPPETPTLRLTNNERKRRQRQAAQLSRKMKKATRRKNRRAA